MEKKTRTVEEWEGIVNFYSFTTLEDEIEDIKEEVSEIEYKEIRDEVSKRVRLKDNLSDEWYIIMLAKEYYTNIVELIQGEWFLGVKDEIERINVLGNIFNEIYKDKEMTFEEYTKYDLIGKEINIIYMEIGVGGVEDTVDNKLHYMIGEEREKVVKDYFNKINFTKKRFLTYIPEWVYNAVTSAVGFEEKDFIDENKYDTYAMVKELGLIDLTELDIYGEVYNYFFPKTKSVKFKELVNITNREIGKLKDRNSIKQGYNKKSRVYMASKGYNYMIIGSQLTFYTLNEHKDWVEIKYIKSIHDVRVKDIKKIISILNTRE